MPVDSILATVAVLAVFVGLLAALWLMKRRGVGFTPRVFTALGLGIALGVGIQLALGRGSDAASAALDWMAVVGQGYIALLKMLVMPLVFVAIVGAFTRTKVTENLGRISAVVLAVLLGTVAAAALTGWAAVALSGLAGASFTDAGAGASAASLEALQADQQQVANLTLPQMILSFIPMNVFADLAGSRSTSTIAVVIFAAIVGLLVGTPVLRLQGDYLAIVTLAFGEIIADLINCLLVGYDASGLHILFNVSGTKTIDDLGLDATGYAIIKGAQGATGTKTIAGLTAGFILVMVTLIIVLNLTRSRAGRAIMAIRDNPIAAQSVGLNLTKYKLMAFVTSAALAGAAGALYGLNYSSLQSVKFNFNTSILVLVFVVLGGLGNIWGSLLSAAALTILPEALRQFADYRMLVYAIVLIFVMLATNNPRLKAFFAKLLPRRHSAEEKEV